MLVEPNSPKNAKTLFWIAIAAVIVGATLLYARGEDSPSVERPIVPGAEAPTSKETTLEGRTTCLPHKDKAGPQTLECAFGLESAAGQFYALDAGALDPDASARLNSAERVRVTGLLVPIEALSTDFWQRYDVRGIMRVDSFEAI